MDLTQFYHILDKLQTSTIQSYIINLGREYSRLLDEDLNMKQVIEKGSEILNKLFIKRLVVKENTSDGKVSKIMITPKLDITLSDRIKFYPIETEVPEYNRQSYTLNDKRYVLILHNQFGISRVSTKCLDTIKKLSSIPIQIDSSLSDWTRIPKNIEALEQENFKKESDLFRNTQKEYHNKIVYFHYRFDNRGRMYNNGYTLNPQGDEYSKSAITLANKEIITDEGSKYLIYDIANNYGLDKLTRERKLAWFEDNKEMIIETGHKSLFKEEADKPLLFQKGCKAYLDYLEGKESGYICQMDATASFAQIMAVLSKDKDLAIITNLTDVPNRYDFYSEVIKEFLLVSKSNVDLKTARNYLKKALMVWAYNGEKEFNRVITKPENRKLFKEILQSVAKGAYEIREAINNVYLELSDRALFNYILPDNFQVSLPQIDTERVKVSSPFYNVTVQYDVNRPNIENNRRFLAPSFIHSIDAYIAREMIRRVDYDMLVNHDSFMSHPNNCEKSLEHYKDILNKINYSNLFDNLLSQMYGQKIESKFTNREPLNLIHRSTYALC